MPGSTLASATTDVPAASRPSRIASPGVVRRFVRNPAGIAGAVMVGAVIAVALLAGTIAPGDPLRTTPFALLAPSGAYPFGTDNLGRDVFLGVVHGARTSLTVVGWVVLISTPIGIAVGVVSGYWGGIVEDLLMRITDLFQSVPRFFLALVVLSLAGRNLESLIVLLGVTSWTLLARVIRSETLTVKRREFVEAARAMGASEARILVQHVLPHVLPAGIVIIALTSSRVILLESTLSFLGLGDPRQISWGFLIGNAQVYLDQAWWLSVFPGAAIVIAVVGLNLVGDALSAVLSPLSSGRGRRRPAGTHT